MPRVQIVQRKTKGERKQQRNSLGNLHELIVAKATHDRYFEAVSRFLDFMSSMGYEYPTSFQGLDSKVCEFIELLWNEGEPKAYASDTISGLGHFIPACKRSLIGSWRLHGGWSRSELPSRALPLTPLMAYAMAQRAFEKGWQDMTVLILLGFSRFARTGELFNARVGDFVFDANLKRAVWSLPLSKSGQRFGARESITIDDVWIVHALSNFCRKKWPGDSIRLASPQTMRHRFKTLCSDLHLPEGIAWYSLRRGGATHLFRITNNLPLVCLIGRWGNQKTARIYVTDALAQLTEISLSRTVRLRLLKLAQQARPGFDFDAS